MSDFEIALNNYLNKYYSNYSTKNKILEDIFINKLKRMIKYYYNNYNNVSEINQIFALIIQEHYDEIKLF